MEAARILKAIGVRPRRTIRVALWSGEEQGLLGSRGYVAKHFATRPISEEPEEMELPLHRRERLWPITPLRDHDKVSTYFNLDNGAGKILGIFAEDNAAAAPIFEAWLKPFHDLGAVEVLMRHTSGTDHRAFDAVGLPAFQFIQDMRDYMSRTHHTNLDDIDYARRENLMQDSVIMASFVYHAAMRDEMMPRKPLPQKPLKWDDVEDEEDEEDDDD
jgi:Zn-dependent M28 family amino/carboxypeptidase